MDNIYQGIPVKILQIKKHTAIESSFVLNVALKGVLGQFVMVSLPNAGEIPISISGFGSDFIEVTIRNAGLVTSKIFNLNIGDYLYVRGPYGNGFPLKEFQLQHLLLIVGGSAIAPVKPIVESFIEGNFSLKKLDVLVGFKSPKYILFRNELEIWKKKCHQVMITVDNDEDYAWMGSIGFVVQFIKDVHGIGQGTRVIVIGPPLMMRNAVNELVQNNVKAENIWVSFERHMKCGVGKCGHCRIGDKYVCSDGPVFNYLEAKELID